MIAGKPGKNGRIPTILRSLAFHSVEIANISQAQTIVAEFVSFYRSFDQILLKIVFSRWAFFS